MLKDLHRGLSELYGSRLRGLYLFGSYSRGEEESESDVDVLIVLDTLDRYAAEVEYTGELTAELSLQYGVSLSRAFVSERDWTQGETVFLQNVREEAIAV